MSRIPRYWK